MSDKQEQTTSEEEVEVLEAEPVELDEEAMIEAAKRAGEAAADEDFKQDADKLRKERDELQKELDGLSETVEAAKKEAADATDKMLRLQADWENFRRRTAAERLAEKERAAEKVVLAMLPVLDDMERALEHANTEENEQLKQFVEGVSAIHDKMFSVLTAEGVELINPVGEPFNPEEHQAVGRVENSEAPDESVAQVYQRGYRMGGKIIRSAMVTVNYGGPKAEAEPESE